MVFFNLAIIKCVQQLILMLPTKDIVEHHEIRNSVYLQNLIIKDMCCYTIIVVHHYIDYLVRNKRLIVYAFMAANSGTKHVF